MVLIAVTGHVDVSDATATWVTAALRERLRRERARGVCGITCLAEGADQLFAKVVLELEGTLDVVLPARDYGRKVIRAGNKDQFGALLRRARTVRTMPFELSGREAYLAASEEMLAGCHLLLAIWDGLPSQGLGDTAHVVARAHERRVPVEILWPGRGSDVVDVVPETRSPAEHGVVLRPVPEGLDRGRGVGRDALGRRCAPPPSQVMGVVVNARP